MKKWPTTRFNSGQRQMLMAWPKLLTRFLRQEWRSAGLGYFAGALVAISPTFVTTYAGSHTEWALNYTNLIVYWKLVNKWVPNFWFILVPIALIVLLKIASVGLRAARSWLLGVTSGAVFWPSVATASCFWSVRTLSIKRGAMALAATCLALLLGFLLRMIRVLAHEKTVYINTELDQAEGTSYFTRDADSPIESWDEDRLGRSSFVNMLAAKILVSKAPVIALRGGFGDGKSSVLNLLRLRLGRNAVVVSFSSWLPDSQQTLVNDLFGDIAAEIDKHLIIPGLRKRLLKFASLLGGAVPYLRALPDIIPPYTQRQEIRDLGNVLGRLPKRVVVLLDEIDRMQKDELLALLKVIRGASSLPNLTFVCALHQEQVETLACGHYDASSHEFFEKFFPTAIDLPKPSPDVLRQMLCDQILRCFEGPDWFRDEPDRGRFVERINQLWDHALILVCTNVRKIGLVANDVHAAAVLLKGEVDPLDLCALEAIRRFQPKVYDVIWTNGGFFSNSDSWWKSREFRSDAEVATQTQNIANMIKAIAREDNSEPSVNALLGAMFPERSKELLGGRRRSTTGDEFAKAEQGKRISHPDYFPVYFRWEVPSSLFSSAEMSHFENELLSAASDTELRSVFQNKLGALEPGSLRRYDFIHKLALELEKLPINIAKSICFVMAQNAEKFGDDFLVSEGRRVLSGTFAVAQRLSGSGDINRFIVDCIGLASTDLFAARLYKFMTVDRANNKVVVDFERVDESAIQNAFAGRMSVLYGPTANLASLNATTLEIHAFVVWSAISPTERDKEISFWERYIGQSRGRLAEAFDAMAPRGTFWTKDSNAYIDQMIPLATLSRMDANLTSDRPLEERYEAALSRLRNFLDGELREGEIL